MLYFVWICHIKSKLKTQRVCYLMSSGNLPKEWFWIKKEKTDKSLVIVTLALIIFLYLSP